MKFARTVAWMVLAFVLLEVASEVDHWSNAWWSHFVDSAFCVAGLMVYAEKVHSK